MADGALDERIGGQEEMSFSRRGGQIDYTYDIEPTRFLAQHLLPAVGLPSAGTTLRRSSARISKERSPPGLPHACVDEPGRKALPSPRRTRARFHAGVGNSR